MKFNSENTERERQKTWNAITETHAHSLFCVRTNILSQIKEENEKKPRNNLEQPQRDRLCNRFELCE